MAKWPIATKLSVSVQISEYFGMSQYELDLDQLVGL